MAFNNCRGLPLNWTAGMTAAAFVVWPSLLLSRTSHALSARRTSRSHLWRVQPLRRAAVIASAEEDSAKEENPEEELAEGVAEVKKTVVAFRDEVAHGNRDSGGNDGQGWDAKGGGSGDWSEENSRWPALLLLLQTLLGKILKLFLKCARYLFKYIPPKILTAIIGLASGYAGQQRHSRMRSDEVERKKEAERKKRVAESEYRLRELYDNNHGPLLKAAAKLSERLYVLVTGLSLWENDVDTGHASSPYNGTVYTAYLVGRYLAFVEHIKKQSSDSLDLGYPAADRVLLNILGRIQSALAASDDVLYHIQSTEAAFKPDAGVEPYTGGPFSITPRAQAAIGELMWRVSDTTATVRYGPADVVSFSEFATKLQTNHELRTWMRPVVVQLECLRRAARKANVDSSGHRSSGKRAVKRTSSSIAPKLVGARPYFIQSSLLDLVEFLDPEPYRTVRPDYRKRLMLGQEHHAHQSRLPPSLFALYQELAKIRDREVSRDDHLRPFRGKPMEVFVKLDCPYSQRVLISLNLPCVTHRAIPINSDNLPSWYYLLSGGSRVPLVFCNGSLITGAKHIVGFLADKYPKKAKAALARSDIDRTSMSKLEVGVTRVGTMAYTRFFPAFRTAMRSDRAEDVDSLQKELRNLNTTVASLQRKRTKCAPFLGGMRFSREDTALAPMLNAVEGAGPALKGKDYGIPDDCISLKEYLKAARRMPCFMEAVPNDEVIVDGYRSLVTKRRDWWSRPWFRGMLE